MSREIKFRAWDKDDEYIRDWDNLVMIRYSSQGDSIFNDNDFVTEQFTGLHDKNGKEIYEGDIVEFENIFGAFLRTAIKYEAPFFVLGDLLLGAESFKQSQIIGNIHENPELLNNESEQ